MFNILIDELPMSVVVDGYEYDVNYRADNMIRLSVLIEETYLAPDDNEGYAELAMEQLALFYPVIPGNLRKAMSELIKFYSYSPSIQPISKNKTNSGIGNNRSYSLKYDAGSIYAAFAQQYPNRDIKLLHWFEFKAMLEGLTDACMFVKIMQYRNVKIDSDMSKSTQQFYRRMKQLYALPDERPQEVQEGEFANALFYL